jgi:hypothetical protein
MCQATYGGNGAAQLFVMPSDGNVGDAQPVSGGRSCSAQPYAFAYRGTLDSACIAQLQDGVDALQSAAAQRQAAASMAAAPASGDPIALPRPMLSRFEDPETLADLSGGLPVESIREFAPSGVASATGRNIRIVGAADYEALLQRLSP